MRRAAALATLLALAGCGAPDPAPAPENVSTDEARALEEAGEMLDDPRAQRNTDAAQP